MSGGAAGAVRPAYQHSQSGRLVAALIGTGVIAVSVLAGARLAAAGAPPGTWVALAVSDAVVLPEFNRSSQHRG